jgi:hypothetical protein
MKENGLKPLQQAMRNHARRWGFEPDQEVALRQGKTTSPTPGGFRLTTRAGLTQ